jgi:hypothetical protein
MRVSTANLMGQLDMALSNYAKGYRNADHITDLLFPRLEVVRQRDVYWIYGKENLQLTEQTLRATGTGAQETRFSLSTGAYFAASHALKSVVPDEDRMAYTVGDLNMDSVQLNQDKILLDREYRAMQLATNPANYVSSNTVALSGTAQLDNAASDPLLLAATARKTIAQNGAVKMNTLVLGFDVAEVLRRHPALLQRFQFVTITGSLSDEQLATVFNVDKVVVGGAVTNSPTTGLNTFVWSNFMLFVYVTPTVGKAGLLSPVGAEGSVGPKQLSYGKSFTWIGGPETVGGYGVTIARHPDASAKSDVVSVDWYSDEQITASDVGYLVTNALAANN